MEVQSGDGLQGSSHLRCLVFILEARWISTAATGLSTAAAGLSTAAAGLSTATGSASTTRLWSARPAWAAALSTSRSRWISTAARTEFGCIDDFGRVEFLLRVVELSSLSQDTIKASQDNQVGEPTLVIFCFRFSSKSPWLQDRFQYFSQTWKQQLGYRLPGSPRGKRLHLSRSWATQSCLEISHEKIWSYGGLIWKHAKWQVKALWYLLRC